LLAEDFRKKYIKEEHLHKFSVIALINDVKWIELELDQEMPLNTFNALRMRGTLKAWGKDETD